MHHLLSILLRPVAMWLLAAGLCWASYAISPLIPEGRLKAVLYKRRNWIKPPDAKAIQP